MRRFRIWHSSKGMLLTPSGLLLRVALAVLVFLILHAMGFRRYTTLLSGTSPTGADVAYIDSLKMVAYVVTYLFAPVLGPILVIAAGTLAMLQRKFMPCSSEQKNGESSPESCDAPPTDGSDAPARADS